MAAPDHSQLNLTTTPAASSGWLARLNQWRQSTGVSALTENSTWSSGDSAHALYMVKNDLVTHYETPGVPYYTTAGDTAARNGNIQVSSTTNTSDQGAIDWWMAAPFHAMGMMDPRLTSTGFGSYREVKSGWQEGAALDTLRGNSFTGGSYPVYYPGNGTSEPLTTNSGGEFPDPLQACPGYSAPTGLPVFIEIGGNVNTTAGPVHSFTGNGVSLNHCVIDSSNSAVGSYLYARGGVVLVPEQPLQNGVRYVVALTVNGTPYTWSFRVGPFAPSVTGVSPSAGPAGSATAVTITGTGFGSGVTGVKFGTTSAATFSVVNDTTVTAVSPAHVAGTVDVTVTGAAGISPISSLDHFTFGACISVTDSAAPASPQGSGTTVTFTATAAGCSSPQYQFWILPPGSSTWQIKQAYSSMAVFSWNTTGLPAGQYLYTVWARDSTSSGASCSYLGCNDAFFPGTVYSLGSTSCTSVTDSAAPASPQLSGTSVTFTAAASGCPHPLYQFWLLAPGSSTWQIKQPYSSIATFSWNTSGMPSGSYLYTVWARDSGSTGTACSYLGCNDAFFPGTAFTLGSTPCTSVSDSPSIASPQQSGASVTFTAVASGCPHPLYQFWILPAGSSTWQIKQPYSSMATFSWNTTGMPAGNYLYTAWARDSGSTGTSCSYLGCNDAFFPGTAFSLTTQPCTSVTDSAAPASPQASGTTVIFTAVASGCPHPLYQFWILAPGQAWQVLKPYSTAATFNWTTTGLPAGSYMYTVWARDSGSTGTSCSYLGCDDVFFPGTAYTLS
jgi:IPT/TIG domain/Cysteine-rich secretory protein family